MKLIFQVHPYGTAALYGYSFKTVAASFSTDALSQSFQCSHAPNFHPIFSPSEGSNVLLHFSAFAQGIWLCRPTDLHFDLFLCPIPLSPISFQVHRQCFIGQHSYTSFLKYFLVCLCSAS